MQSAESKLLSYLKPYAARRTALAFSGGADSTLLLALLAQLCKEEGGEVIAFYVKSALNPRLEDEEACRICADFKVQLEIIDIDILDKIKNNPADRCYICKKTIFLSILKKAHEFYCDEIFDGTNGDDLKEYRPGLKALAELKIKSPLAELNIDKTTVRAILKAHNIAVAGKPSSPCLATRFPYGTYLTQDKINAVGLAESKIKTLGFYNVRVRAHDNVARIELDGDQFNKAFELRSDLVSIIKGSGFTYAALDLEGFKSGSMDKELKQRSAIPNQDDNGL